MLRRFIAWLRFKRQRFAFAAAIRRTRRYDGFVVSRAVYFQAIDKLTAFAQTINQSGDLATRKHHARRMALGIADTLQTLVNAARLGDPHLQMDEVRQRYYAQRVLSMSRRQRLAFDRTRRASAVAAFAAGGPPRGLTRRVRRNPAHVNGVAQ